MLMVEIFAGLCFSVSVSICGTGLSVCKLFVTVGAAEMIGTGVIDTVAGIEPEPDIEGVPLLT